MGSINKLKLMYGNAVIELINGYTLLQKDNNIHILIDGQEDIIFKQARIAYYSIKDKIINMYINERNVNNRIKLCTSDNTMHDMFRETKWFILSDILVGYEYSGMIVIADKKLNSICTLYHK